MPLLEAGKAEAGLLIHEGRFLLDPGFWQVEADLGLLWEAREALPLPLGGLFLSRPCVEPLLEEVLESLEASLAWARAHPRDPDLWNFIESYSHMGHRKALEAHVDLYVGEETHGMTARGWRALERMEELWWARVDSNHRPHAYQACTLTS